MRARLPLLALSLLSAACGVLGAHPVLPDDGTGPSRVTEEFNAPDASFWSAQTHPLGRGRLQAGNVRVGGGNAILTLPAGSYDGAELRSTRTFHFGAFAARMRAPIAPGSVSALFLYQGQLGDANDEIDIELLNDGSRTVLLTVWLAGREVHHHRVTLPFDPAVGFHEYGIEWTADRARFVADGRLLHQFTGPMPRNPMYLLANAWWPVWLSGPPPAAPAALLLDRVWVRR